MNSLLTIRRKIKFAFQLQRGNFRHKISLIKMLNMHLKTSRMQEKSTREGFTLEMCQKILHRPKIDFHRLNHISVVMIAIKSKRALLVKSSKSVSNRKSSPYNNSKCDKWQTNERSCKTGSNLRKDFGKMEVSKTRSPPRMAVFQTSRCQAWPKQRKSMAPWTRKQRLNVK